MAGASGCGIPRSPHTHPDAAHREILAARIQVGRGFQFGDDPLDLPVLGPLRSSSAPEQFPARMRADVQLLLPGRVAGEPALKDDDRVLPHPRRRVQLLRLVAEVSLRRLPLADGLNDQFHVPLRLVMAEPQIRDQAAYLSRLFLPGIGSQVHLLPKSHVDSSALRPSQGCRRNLRTRRLLPVDFPVGLHYPFA